MIFWACSSCLPTFTTELSALDRISALEVKLEKVDSLISEIQLLKQEINSMKKPDYPYLRAAFRNRTDSTASDRNSKKRKAETNDNVQADKESQNRKPKVFKTGTNNNHQTTVSAIKRPPKRRHLYIGRLSNSVSTDDIKDYCKNKGVDLLCIRVISREEARLKSFHCVFKFDNDQFESPDFWPENVSFSRFYLNQKAREWLASFDTCLSNVKSVNNRVKVCLHNARSVRNKTSQIRNLIEANDFHLIILTETWIKDNANDEFLSRAVLP